MKKVLLPLLLIVCWASNLSADYLGYFRNSTGTPLDSVYIPFSHQDSLWLNLEDGDSVMVVRYRGRSFVDSTREIWSTNDINRAFTAGTWLRAFRASDASGNIGQYTVFVGGWKNGNFFWRNRNRWRLFRRGKR